MFFIWWQYSIFLVSCRGVVQLGGPDPWDNQVGPAKVGAGKSFLFTKGNGRFRLR